MMTRRALLAASAAVSGATTSAAGISKVDRDERDGDLLVLRPLWRETLDAFDAVLAAKAPIETRSFARRPAYPSREALLSDDAYDAEFARIGRVFEAIQAEEGLTDIERREAWTMEAYHAVVDRIVACRARTIPGLRFKVEVSRAFQHGHDGVLRSIVEDLEGMFTQTAYIGSASTSVTRTPSSTPS